MKKGWYWPWLIVALLVATAAGQGVMLYASTHDPSMVIEPDYYQKAVAWDSQMAQDSVNRALGWRAGVAVGAIDSDGAEVSVALTDSSGTAVDGARVNVTAVHNLDGARHVVGVLTERADQSYAARLPLDRAGQWEFRLDAVRDGEHFTSSVRAEAPSASQARAGAALPGTAPKAK
ncbi:MAG: FixH family protein [Gemmatimonadales bacterium]